MTAFKLKKKESTRDGIRRVAHERIEHASRLLRDERADPAEAVHKARKDMKKLRSALKLVSITSGQPRRRRRRRGELQGQAFALAERVFTEKPKRFVKRIGSYWEAPAL